MSNHSLESTLFTDLRLKAAGLLAGTDGNQESATRASNALSVLHALASSPTTADHALALLHELQVHQVELNLQAEELRESRAELEADLRRQIDLYHFLPVCCFTVDTHLVVSEANQAGARMLGVEAGGAHGLQLDSFATEASLNVLRALMAKSAAGETASARLEWRNRSGVEREVCAEVAPDPSGRGFLVALTNIGKV